MFQKKLSFLAVLLMLMLLSMGCEQSASPETPATVATSDTPPTPTAAAEASDTPLTPTAAAEASDTRLTPTATVRATDTSTDTLTVSSNPPPIRVGSVLYTEQRLGGKILLLFLQEAGYEVEDKTSLGGTQAVREALINQDIDIYIGLSNLELTLFHDYAAGNLPIDPIPSYEKAKEEDAKLGLVWLDPVKVEGRYILMVLQNTKQQKGIVTVEEVANWAKSEPVVLCTEAEFKQRYLPELQTRYSLEFQDVKSGSLDSNYQNLLDGECDVAQALSTDSRSHLLGLHILEDPKQFLPVYVPGPVVRQDFLTHYPDLPKLLTQATTRINNEILMQLHALIYFGPDGEWKNGDEWSVDEVASFAVTLLQPDIRVGVAEERANCPFITQIGEKLLGMTRLREQASGLQRSLNVETIKYSTVDALQEALVSGQIDLTFCYLESDQFSDGYMRQIGDPIWQNQQGRWLLMAHAGVYTSLQDEMSCAYDLLDKLDFGNSPFVEHEAQMWLDNHQEQVESWTDCQP